MGPSDALQILYSVLGRPRWAVANTLETILHGDHNPADWLAAAGAGLTGAAPVEFRDIATSMGIGDTPLIPGVARGTPLVAGINPADLLGLGADFVGDPLDWLGLGFGGLASLGARRAIPDALANMAAHVPGGAMHVIQPALDLGLDYGVDALGTGTRALPPVGQPSNDPRLALLYRVLSGRR